MLPFMWLAVSLVKYKCQVGEGESFCPVGVVCEQSVWLFPGGNTYKCGPSLYQTGKSTSIKYLFVHF